MNYLQMYINLAVIFSILAFLSLVVFAISLDPSVRAKKGSKVTLGIIFSLLILAIIFCSAMAGLLS